MPKKPSAAPGGLWGLGFGLVHPWAMAHGAIQTRSAIAHAAEPDPSKANSIARRSMWNYSDALKPILFPNPYSTFDAVDK